MKLESERVPETDASPELAAELLRDGARRGAWLSLRDEEDDGNFLQAEESGDGFSLEWRDGSAAPLRRTARPVAAAEAESAFRAFLSGDTDWTAHFDWTDSSGAPVAAFRVTRKGVLVFLAALVAAFLSADLVMRFELYYIGNCGPLSECLDPLALYTEFIEMAKTGAWSDCFGALFEVGILPVPLVAAAICTAVWKTFRKAIPLAALAAALVEVFWFFPFAAGCLC